MNTKLTLNLNKSVIENAKDYAKENSISLSKLIENYLNSLTQKEPEDSLIQGSIIHWKPLASQHVIFQLAEC